MSEYVIDKPGITGLPVAGEDALFPVRRVYCIGRNYAAHAIEMGHDPDREPPFFFQKNPNNLDPSGEFPYPPHSEDVHYEVEMAVMLGKGGVNVAIDDVQALALPVMRHRMGLNFAAQSEGVKTDDVVKRLLEEIPSDEKLYQEEASA